jgi:F-box-like
MAGLSRFGLVAVFMQRARVAKLTFLLYRIPTNDITENIWYHIFSFLPRQSLCTVSLVCKHFQKAAKSHITCLTVSDGELVLPRARPTLEACLEEFPSITGLTLESASAPAWPTLLTVSESITKLKELIIHIRIQGTPAEHVPGDPLATALTSFLRHCTGLTYVSLRNHAVNLDFSDVVRVCWRLRKLRCVGSLPTLDTRESWLPILQLTNLQHLSVSPSNGKRVLPLLRGMQQLRVLRGLLVDDEEGFRCLASLTQLTNVKLRVNGWSDSIAWMAGLGPLTGLAVLVLKTDSMVAGLAKVVSAMPRLKVLWLWFRGNPLMEWDLPAFWASARLNSLTSLVLTPCHGLMLSRLVRPSFSLLRELALYELPQGGANPASLLTHVTRLEHLFLWNVGFEIIPHLSTLTGLTRLFVKLHPGTLQLPLGLPTFIWSLVRLQKLYLDWSLNGLSIEQFMSCFAVLHNLEVLGLSFWPAPPNSGSADNISELGRQQLWPLLGLRLLKVFLLMGPWKIEQGVVDSWQQSRKEMGTRPFELFLMTGPPYNEQDVEAANRRIWTLIRSE